VLVAKRPIQKGTAGSVIADRGLSAAETIRGAKHLQGVFTDPSSLQGMVATQDIVRGSQLTAAEFTRLSG
jgi:flagella basal body P-ring formation protein FlgA